MKKNYLWSMLAVVLTTVFSFGVSSCGDDDPEPEPELTVNKTSLSFEIMGGSLSFNVSSNVSWSISTEGDWFEVNDDSGKDGTTSVTVTAQENTKFESQTGKITVTSSRGNITRVISLSQKGKERQLKVSSNELSFEPEGGQKTFTITSNLDWEISGASDWLEVSPTSGSGDASITITAKPNNSGSRNATVLVKDKEGKASSVSITIKQNEIGLSVSPTSASLLSHQGAQATITVTASGQWNLTSLPDWLHASATSGTGNTSIILTAKTANETAIPRTATLVITSGGKSISVIVSQDGGKSIVYVEPSNIVTLYDEFAFDFNAYGNVNKFQIMWLAEQDILHMTDKEIREFLYKTEYHKFSWDWIYAIAYDMRTVLGFYTENAYIQENTTYYVYTIAYDENDHEGELKKTKIKTPGYLDDDNDAWVNIDNTTYNNSLTSFSFETYKRGYCDTYHLIYGAISSDDMSNRSLYAFEIQYYLKYNKKHWFAEYNQLEILPNCPNNTTYTYNKRSLQKYPVLVRGAWGLFKDGKLSTDFYCRQTDISQSTAPKRNIIINSSSNLKKEKNYYSQSNNYIKR